MGNKLKTKELKRLSLMLGNEIQKQKADFENTKKQNFLFQEKKDKVLKTKEEDIYFLYLIKEKIDSETFLKNG